MEALDSELTLGYVISRFMGLGFDLKHAGQLADEGADWRDAERLLKEGCPVDIAYDILREGG